MLQSQLHLLTTQSDPKAARPVVKGLSWARTDGRGAGGKGNIVEHGTNKPTPRAGSYPATSWCRAWKGLLERATWANTRRGCAEQLTHDPTRQQRRTSDDVRHSKNGANDEAQGSNEVNPLLR